MDKNGDKNNENDLVLEEEIVAEEAELEEATESVKSIQKIKKLQRQLKATEEEKRKFHEELQRTKADFLNSKRRLEEQLRSDKERATDKLLIELLTLVDSFDTAKADEDAWNSVDEKWRSGIDAIHSKLLSLLIQHNVTEVDPQGETFDPEVHEAVSNIPVEDDSQVDKIITVMQKGYMKNETIIRPARVIVGTK